MGGANNRLYNLGLGCGGFTLIIVLFILLIIVAAEG
ncbi:YjcZ family sporulation protein [Virgibacillus sp. NKC19-3]|nr:YjcZ family sporulation protein [Virgibacillus sp. NKC19-3]